MYFLLICIAAILVSVWCIPTEYQKKKKFQIIQPLAIRIYFFLIWFCTFINPKLECVSLFTKWREVGGSFFTWKFEAELQNTVMIYSKERVFCAFLKLISKYLPFIDQFLPLRLFWKTNVLLVPFLFEIRWTSPQNTCHVKLISR